MTGDVMTLGRFDDGTFSQWDVLTVKQKLGTFQRKNINAGNFTNYFNTTLAVRRISFVIIIIIIIIEHLSMSHKLSSQPEL